MIRHMLNTDQRLVLLTAVLDISLPTDHSHVISFVYNYIMPKLYVKLNNELLSFARVWSVKYIIKSISV